MCVCICVSSFIIENDHDVIDIRGPQTGIRVHVTFLVQTKAPSQSFKNTTTAARLQNEVPKGKTKNMYSIRKYLT